MATAATIDARLTLDTKDYNKGLTDAKGKTSKFTGDLKKAGDVMTKVGGIMTASLTVPIVAGMTKAVMAAGDLEQSTGAVEVVFGSAAGKILDFSKTSSTMVGLARSDFQQLSAEAGALLLNMSFDTDTAADATLNLAQRAADMAAVYNTDVSQAMEAIQSGLRGISRPLTAFGVKLDESTIKAKAIELGLVGAGGQMDETAEATARLAVIMDQTNLIAGHFGKEAETLDGQMKRLKAELKDASAELGTHLLPFVTDAVLAVRNLVKRFDDLSPAMQKAIIVFAGLASAAGPAIIVLGQIASITSSLITVIPQAITWVNTLNASLGGTAAAAGAVLGPIAAIAAAVGAIIILGSALDKQTKSNQSSAESLNKTLVDGAGSYEEYAKAVADVNKEHTRTAVVASSSNAAMGLTEDIVVNTSKAIVQLTEDEYELAKAVKMAALDSGYYADMAERAAVENRNLAPTLNQVLENQRAFNEEYKKVTGLSANFSGIISMAKQYDEIMLTINEKQSELSDYMQIIEDGGGYLNGAYVSTKTATEEVSRLTGEIGGLQQRMSEMANQAVLDMFMATIAIDGVTKEEAAAYFKMAADMELISEEAANYAMQVYGDAVDYINGLSLVDKHATYTVDIITSGGTGGFGGAVHIPKKNRPELRAEGGTVNAGSTYIVGEKGMELFTPDRNGYIIPNSEIEKNDTYRGSRIVYNINANYPMQKEISLRQDIKLMEAARGT